MADPATLETPVALAAPATHFADDFAARASSADAPAASAVFAASTSAGAPDSGKTAASNEPVPAVPVSADASAAPTSAGAPDPGKTAASNGPVPAVPVSADASAASTSAGAPDPGKTAASNGLVPAAPASARAPDSAAFADVADPATSAAPDDDAEHLAAPFVQQLVKQLRAQDTHGAWDGKSDLQLLRPYVLTPEERRAIPIIGDPDPETLWRLEIFYNAIAVAIERETRQMVSPMMKMSHEGFGRMVLLAGRLVVVNKQLRDVHRFGFPSLAKLAQTGSQFVAEAVEMIRAWPEIAHYGT